MLVGHSFYIGSTPKTYMNPIAFAVDDLREQYLREMALVRQTYERTGDGTAAIRRRSAVVDRMLIEMWRRAFAGSPGQNVSLVAMGGYGRKDLFPFSDIDVLFAFADEKTEEQSRDAVRGIVQGMWDMGLRASPARARLRKRAASIRTISSSRWQRSTAGFWPATFLCTSNCTRRCCRAGAERVEQHHAKARRNCPCAPYEISATPSSISSRT